MYVRFFSLSWSMARIDDRKPSDWNKYSSHSWEYSYNLLQIISQTLWLSMNLAKSLVESFPLPIGCRQQ